MGSRQFVRWTSALGLVITSVMITSAISTSAEAKKTPVFSVNDQRIQPKHSQSIGHVGCTAASCHGGGEKGLPGSESLTWFESDPHRKAFDVLYDERSKTIAKNYPDSSGKVIPAHKDARCLQCHAPEAITAPQQHLLSPVGVGCESCHGPAGDWGTAHYQTGWKQRSPQQQASESGFYPLKDINFRIKVCASCHVGDENREVTHDLIAAGHPRLAFEYSAYHNLPHYQKHWKEKDPQFETKAWEAGQIVSAQAAVSLLKARADRAGSKDQPWPELSEFACFSCHKELTLKDKNHQPWKEVSDSTHRLGGMRWGSWYNATLPFLAENRGAEVRSLGMIEKLNALTNMVESPTAKPKDVSKMAAEVLVHFDRWIDQTSKPNWKPLTPDEISKGLSLNAVDAKTKKLRNMEWDESMQHYLGLAAARFATRSTTSADDPLMKLRSALRFHSDSKGRIDSPRDTEPGNVLNLFLELQKSPLREQRP